MRTKDVLIYGIIYFFLTLVVLVGFEVFLRIYNRNSANYDIEMWKYSKYLKRKSINPILGVEHLPLKTCRLQDVLITTNSFGFRDKEYCIPKPKNVYRIVVLGSSITLGWGVRESDTYVSLVEQWLQGKTGNLKVEIINTSVGNYNTAREVEAFFSKCLEFEPDMVVVSFFINDPQLIEIKDNFLLKHSQIAVLLWSRYQQLIRIIGIKQDYLGYYKNLYNFSNSGWRVCISALQRLSKYCQQRGIFLLMTMTPEIHNLQKYPFYEAHNIIKRTVLPLGFNFLDFYSVLKDIDAKLLWVMPGDPHFNEKGHLIIAQSLYDFLMAHKPWEKSAR